MVGQKADEFLPLYILLFVFKSLYLCVSVVKIFLALGEKA